MNVISNILIPYFYKFIYGFFTFLPSTVSGGCFIHNHIRGYSLTNSRSERATAKVKFSFGTLLHVPRDSHPDIPGKIPITCVGSYYKQLNWQVLLANKLDDDIKMSYTAVASPLFVSFATLIVMSFNAKGANKCKSYILSSTQC